MVDLETPPVAKARALGLSVASANFISMRRAMLSAMTARLVVGIFGVFDWPFMGLDFICPMDPKAGCLSPKMGLCFPVWRSTCMTMFWRGLKLRRAAGRRLRKRRACPSEPSKKLRDARLTTLG